MPVLLVQQLIDNQESRAKVWNNVPLYLTFQKFT